MKACQDCRYCFEQKLGDTTTKFCRAVPPTTTSKRDGDQITLDTFYSLVTPMACGMWQRRRWWMRDPK